MKRITALLMALAMVFALAACGNEANDDATPDAATEESTSETIVLKLAHEGTVKHSYHIAISKAADEIYEKTNGAVKIDIYSDQVLGTKAECLELLKNGTIDMTMSACAELSAYVPRVAMLELPFLFNNRDHVYKTLDNEELMGKVFDGIEEVGQIVCFYENGIRDWLSNGFAVLSPDDCVGKKMRVMNSQAYLLMADAVGAISTTSSGGEMYTLLQTGGIDMLDNPPSVIEGYALYEVATDFTLTEHSYSSTPVMVSNYLKDKVGEENYNIIIQTLKDNVAYAREVAQQGEEEGLEKIAAAGVTIHELTDEQRSAFATKMGTCWDTFAESVGGDTADLIAEIRALG